MSDAKETKKHSKKNSKSTSYSHLSFDIYISRLLKQVHPDTGISGEVLVEMNNINKYLLTELMRTVNNLLKRHNKKTLDSRDVQSAVRLLFPNQLGRHAVTEGTKAVTKYNSASSTKSDKAVSRMTMAGLVFPIPRVERIMRQLSNADRLGKTASVYMAAVLEYINAEILELAGNAAHDLKKKRISPRHMTLAIMNDIELNNLFCNVTLGGGVLPNISAKLIGKRGK